MAPRFKGGSDDWLDDEGSGSGKKPPKQAKKKPGAKSAFLAPEEANATVSEVYPSLCRVRLDPSEQDVGIITSLLCTYRRSAVMTRVSLDRNGQPMREKSPVAVGDRVKVEKVSQQDGIVAALCERKNRLLRSAPDRDQQQANVIVANIDLLVIVCAAKNPDFSTGIVDRFLIAAQAEGIPSLLCVNKMDLSEEESKPWDIYRSIGLEVVETSAKKQHGVLELMKHLADRQVAFCGHSGVGKTSLLRELLGTEIGQIGSVNESTGKGRHTTTGAVLLEASEGRSLIDTPGVREFGLFAIDPDTLSEYFPEFRDLACSQRSCTHLDAVDCDATTMARYGSFRRIHQSLIEEGR